MSAPAVADRGWVFGALPDLLLGCGLGYALLAGGAALLASDPSSLLAWAILLSTLTGMPHYGATLLRVYERRADRRRYAFFAVWATLAIWAAFVAGVYDRTIGSLLVTLYLSWSPWHYTGQNYGLALLFLRKRGIDVAPATKRWIHASFVASYVLVFLAMHGGSPRVGYGSGLPADVLEHGYRFVSVGIPVPLVAVLFPALGLAYLAATGVAVTRLRRAAAGRGLGPTLALCATQAAWFVIPASAAFATGVDPRHQVLFFFAWVAVGHQVQYLWITTWYAAGSSPLPERIAYLGKTFLAGAGIWTLPAIVFSPALLGTVSYDLGLFLLISAAVNLHHFVLDGAIWKLRDGRVARLLLRTPGEPPARDPYVRRGRRIPLRGAAWAAGAGLVALAFASQAERFAGERAARLGDFARVELAAQRLERMGQASPTVRVSIARGALRRGDVVGALRELERARAIYPTAAAWTATGLAHEHSGDERSALEAYDRALALDPANVGALANGARVLRRLGRTEEARERAERALAAAPGNRRVRLLLESLGTGDES